MSDSLRHAAKSAVTLLVFAILSTALMGGGRWATLPAIQASEQTARLARLQQVLPVGAYDNNVLATATPLSLQDGPVRFYQRFLALKGQRPQYLIIEAETRDGYAGPIRFLVSLLPDGRIGALRVVQHKETPGLGDYIDAGRSQWAAQFSGKSLTQPAESGWQVRKDGGEFDAVAGATVTPRALVRAIHRVLQQQAMHPEWWQE